MKTLLRDIRIIPILLIATCCLVVLKVSGLLLEGGYILNDTPKPKSWAQETFNFPSPGKLDSSDVTGSVAAKDDKPVVAAPEVAPIPDDKVVYPDPNRAVTASERAVLESLQARRQEIEARAREIEIRESLMKSAEKRIEGKIEEMKATEARVSVAGQQKQEQEAARFKGLVTMYEAMKPKDAARVFDRLELSVLFEIASQIAPRKMSDIMGQMQPEAAERLTVELARRSTGDRSSSANDLPKIEGRPQAPVRN
ncbi:MULTISPECIES: flagellar protein FlbB [unclassified Afipia]|uniref:MotE family protein n=1 Tax=unclassified Afipia TaxID=2642050 RepID=UPI000400E25D|nr:MULTISPECIES: flagellar protein FlbB [unclassified Afipia]